MVDYLSADARMILARTRLGSAAAHILTTARSHWFEAGLCGFAVLTIGSCALASFAAAVPGNLDDVFIVLVYARHLLSDGQIYWNIEDGPVEGYTSPLDLLVKVLGTAAAPDAPFEAVMWTSLALHCICGMLFFFLVLRLTRDARFRWRYLVALLSGLVVASSGALAYGSSMLLETPLFVLSAIGAICALCSPGKHTSNVRLCTLFLLLVALALARPEGIPVALICLAFFCIDHHRLLPRRKLVLLVGGFCATMLIFFLWRRLYFGYWAPNTYYAKTSSSRWHEIVDGVGYLRASWGSPTGKLILAAAAAGILAPFSRSWAIPMLRRCSLFVWTLLLVSTAIVVVAGGDPYQGERFLALPFALATLVLAMASVALRPAWRWVVVVPLAGSLIVQVGDMRGDSKPVGRQVEARSERAGLSFACQEEAMLEMAAVNPDLAVAQSDCQRFKFFSDRTRVIDLHGLNDEAIAHEPTDRPVRWGKYSHEEAVRIGAPIWIWGHRWITSSPLSEIPLERLVSNPDLVRRFTGYGEAPRGESREKMVRDYVPVSLRTCGGGSYFNFLVRREYASQFRAAGMEVGR